jgi:S-adenosylmethionine hydrolase
MTARPVLTFLTDFGPDGPAPICRGVMLSIAPDAQIVDIGHHVRKFAIRDGAFLLWCALPYMPRGVHVAVVDPGVGTTRRPIAILTVRGDVLVGPDNGLLIPAAGKLGGIAEARTLENRDLWLDRTSSTFHGRDIFSPVAAHLATGTPFSDVGPFLPTAELVQLALPQATVRDGGLDTGIAFIDDFGNLRLAGHPRDLDAAVGGLAPGRELMVEFADPALTERTTWQRTFGTVPVGASLLYEDSFGTISLADNQGSIASRLGLAVDRPARIRAA